MKLVSDTPPTPTAGSLLRRLEQEFKRLFLAAIRLLVRERPCSDPASRAFKSIVIIRQHDQLGDMLCAVPLLRALRGKYPEAALAVVASPVNHHVMLHHPFVDRVILYDKREMLVRGRIRPRSVFQFLRTLRQLRAEMAIVPTTVSLSVTSDLTAYFSGAACRIGAAELSGSENPSAFLFNHAVRLDWRSTPHRHQTLRNLDIARELAVPTSDLRLTMGFAENEQQEAGEFIARHCGIGAMIVSYHPGAGKEPNRWPADRFAALANLLAAQLECFTLVTCGPMDPVPVKQMVSRLTVPHFVVEGKSIRDVAAILSLVSLVITNDTGIMHVAGASGTRVLSLFGPTDPEQWAPKGEENRYILSENGSMESITVEEVLAVARDMLRNSVGPRPAPTTVQQSTESPLP